MTMRKFCGNQAPHRSDHDPHHRSRVRFDRGQSKAVRVGAAVVELALVTPLLLILALGTCELGQAYRVDAVLSAATRAGCTTGTRPGCSNVDVISDVQAVLVANGISANLATVRIQVNGATGEVANATLDDKITVTVSVPTSQVVVANTLRYLGVNSNLSQTSSMLKQG